MYPFLPALPQGITHTHTHTVLHNDECIMSYDFSQYVFFIRADSISLSRNGLDCVFKRFKSFMMAVASSSSSSSSYYYYYYCSFSSSFSSHLWVKFISWNTLYFFSFNVSSVHVQILELTFSFFSSFLYQRFFCSYQNISWCFNIWITTSVLSPLLPPLLLPPPFFLLLPIFAFLPHLLVLCISFYMTEHHNKTGTTFLFRLPSLSKMQMLLNHFFIPSQNFA